MRSALLVIDVQLDFCPGGRLAVPEGHEVVPVCNRLIAEAPTVVLTQDWHPAGHGSFASTHAAEPFSTITMPYGEQVLWPDHCVEGSQGAAFHPDLHTDAAHLILRKGTHPHVDSYSAFQENDRQTPTGLDGWLRSRGVERVVVVGLATDFCVRYSAIDAVQAGFTVEVVRSAVRGITPEGVEAAWEAMRAAGVTLV